MYLSLFPRLIYPSSNAARALGKMNRIRRPWTATRRDTDGVQMNTLDPVGKSTGSGPPSDTKGGNISPEVSDVDIEHGHLQEIEVDVAKVLHDDTIEDIESDTSPYPEGCPSISIHQDHY